MLATISRSAMGIVAGVNSRASKKLQAEVAYKGGKEDVQRNEAIMAMLRRGDSWNDVVAATGR